MKWKDIDNLFGMAADFIKWCVIAAILFMGVYAGVQYDTMVAKEGAKQAIIELNEKAK